MYEQIDGISACPDLVCVGRATSRRPWVPRQGAPNRPMYLNLGLMYLYLGPPDRAWVPRAVLGPFRRPPGGILASKMLIFRSFSQLLSLSRRPLFFIRFPTFFC